MDCSFAFQPIVDGTTGHVYSYEALLRGQQGESAAYVLSRMPAADTWRIDEQAWPVALAWAARLGLTERLHLNATPDGLANGILPSLLLASRHIPLNQIIVEVTEAQLIGNSAGFRVAIDQLRASGVLLAIDDFGAGYSGLNLLADFQPDLLKLDQYLVRDIESSGPRQAIARGILQVAEDLGIDTVVEGVEHVGEAEWFRDAGARYFQGYLFARPGFEVLPAPRTIFATRLRELQSARS